MSVSSSQLGWWTTLTLLPSALTVPYNPDDKSLKDVMPPALYARWETQRDKHLLGYNDTSNEVDRWRPWFAAAALDWPEPARGQSFTDLGILLEAAASGLGVAVCNRRIAGRWIDGGQLLPLFGLAVPAPSTYHALVQRDHAQRPEVAAFLEWLGATFA